MGKFIIVLLCLTALAGCDRSQSTRSYLDTDHGLVYAGPYYCKFGVLLNYEYINVYGPDNNPIKCDSRVLKFTDNQRATFRSNFK